MVALEETIDGWKSYFIVQMRQDLELLFQDLLLRVSVVRDVNEILDFGHVDLFILGSNEHRGDTKKLIFATWDFLFLTVAVNYVHGDE